MSCRASYIESDAWLFFHTLGWALLGYGFPYQIEGNRFWVNVAALACFAANATGRLLDGRRGSR